MRGDLTGKSRRTRHGKSHTLIHKVWRSMLYRCINPNAKPYGYYGGRGIKVCDRWLTFENFLADMGDRPSESHTLERRDNNGDYEPANCYWATRLEQGNNKRNNRLITHAGETLTMSEWSRRTGLGRQCLHARLKRLGWSASRALTTPKRGTE